MSPDRKLIFPPWILCEFLTAWECQDCGQSGKRVWLKFPVITQPRRDVIVLQYPVKCPCGSHGCLNVSLPLLLFCYVVGRLDLLELRRRRRKAEMQVLPEESELLFGFIRDFELEVIELAPGIAENLPPKDNKPPEPQAAKLGRPGDHERFGFELTEQEWVEFLRRLGFEDNQDSDGKGQQGDRV